MSGDDITKHSWKGKIFRFLLGVVILSFALYIGRYWVKNKPRARRNPPKHESILVEGMKAEVSDHRVVVRAMGTVVPARRLDLSSRVAGEVVRTSDEFFPGGYFKKGDLVVEIDKVDYNLLVEESELALEKAGLAVKQNDLAIEQSELVVEQSKLAIEQRRADIVKVEKDLALERGRQKIAKSEFDVLGEKISKSDEELVLRKPQLKASLAAVDAARARLKEAESIKKQAEAKRRSAEDSKRTAIATKKQAEVSLEKARLSLKRTEITAPFNFVIQAKKVDKGSQVNVGTPIVTIIDTNEYWIEVSVPMDRLKWIDIPDRENKSGSHVRIYHESAWGKEMFREGETKRLMTEVKSQDRMARLLVSVKDPISLEETNKNKPKMILGTYVRAEIQGDRISNAVKIPRNVVNDVNRVWIMSPDNTLDIRRTEIVWSDRDFVYIDKGVDRGEFIITSDLASPVQGMALRLNSE